MLFIDIFLSCLLSWIKWWWRDVDEPGDRGQRMLVSSEETALCRRCPNPVREKDAELGRKYAVSVVSVFCVTVFEVPKMPLEGRCFGSWFWRNRSMSAWALGQSEHVVEGFLHVMVEEIRQARGWFEIPTQPFPLAVCLHLICSEHLRIVTPTGHQEPHTWLLWGGLFSITHEWPLVTNMRNAIVVFWQRKRTVRHQMKSSSGTEAELDVETWGKNRKHRKWQICVF